MRVYGLICPRCKKDTHDPVYTDFYMCCGKPLALYCKTCEQMYYNSRTMLKQGETYICTECGQPHYGYTKYKQVCK